MCRALSRWNRAAEPVAAWVHASLRSDPVGR
jgi:hypothetical protein